MKLIQSIKAFIRAHHPDKQWRKLSPSKIFESPSLSQTIKKKYVPLWFKAFYDEKNALFYERLDHNLKPKLTGTRRLLSQCRQLYLYTEVDTQKKKLLPLLARPYESLIKYFYQGEGRWIFSIDDETKPLETYYDFYAHAFLILALTSYGKAAHNQDAIKIAKDTFFFIKTHMNHQNGNGYTEALNPDLSKKNAIRRQNPHMHFFEACLFAFESTNDMDYLTEAHNLFSLFKNYFFDRETNTLREFFNDDLMPHNEKGNQVEAGHHFEWVWLLDFYAKLAPMMKDEIDTYKNLLYDFACRHGYDPQYDGIFDACDPEGNPLIKTKRIWVLSEAIRAHRVMRDHDKRAVPLLEQTKTLLNTRYLCTNGAWVESWTRDFKTKAVDDLPATSVYHL